jgi:hypothetical protein
LIFQNNPSQCTTISFCQCRFLPTLFLFTNVFPWFMYVADTTLQTVALNTPNNVAVFVTDAPAKHAATIFPLSKSDKSPIFQFFHMDCHSTQSLMHWHEHYRAWTKGRTFSVVNWSSFNVDNTNKFYSSIF